MNNGFIPDIAIPRSEAPTVTPLAPPSAGKGLGTEEAPSFKDQVYSLLKDVNDKIVTSDQNVQDLAMGKSKDLDRVVTSVEEANLALSYTIAIRSKLLDAYNEISRITV
ncbi:MAG: flagellar hook-basal body complex protein FliE [Vulcanimicrobiaceae bacterium]